jgi:hypothetical protein
MRVASSITSISWIPSEAVTGLNKGIFESGFTHYDEPPPDHITDLEALRDRDGFRCANQLSVWIEAEDGRPVACGRGGGGMMGATTVRLGKKAATFEAVALEDLRPDLERTETSVRFVQTTGGRTALPARRSGRRSSSSLPRCGPHGADFHADGRVELEVVGASKFPRH